VQVKVQIDIDEEVVAQALQKKVAEVIAQRVAAWGTESEIKARIDRIWGATLDRLCADQLALSDKLKERIAAEIERKLRRKIATLMNATGADGAVSPAPVTP
jgi:acyl-CoA hydrolase